jgi:DNA-binding NarL/FixJ family response regulator
LPSATVIPAVRFVEMDGLVDRGWADVVGVAVPTRREPDMILLSEVRNRWPAARLVVLSSDHFPDTAATARDVEANAYVTIGCAPETVAEALRAAKCGESFYPGDLGATPAQPRPMHAPEDLDARIAKLTSRERQVMDMLGHGCANDDIAEKLNLREGTVRIYVHRVIKKLGLRNRLDVALCARSVE